MKRLLIVGVLASLAASASPARAAFMNFEQFLGHDTAPISTFYTGISFQSGAGGSDWVARDATTGSYNVSSWPSGTSWGAGNYWIYDLVSATTALDYTGNDGVIAFDNEDATFVQMGYSAGSTLYLDAYDSGGTLLDSDNGPANLRYVNGNESGPGTLRVDAPLGQLISYVVVHDTGNFWTVDNISTDASGIVINTVPVPGAILLGTLGAGLVSWLRRRRSL
jgi:hypothetical protein